MHIVDVCGPAEHSWCGVAPSCGTDLQQGSGQDFIVFQFLEEMVCFRGPFFGVTFSQSRLLSSSGESV